MLLKFAENIKYDRFGKGTIVQKKKTKQLSININVNRNQSTSYLW